jgi:hypothetical protein
MTTGVNCHVSLRRTALHAMGPENTGPAGYIPDVYLTIGRQADYKLSSALVAQSG